MHHLANEILGESVTSIPGLMISPDDMRRLLDRVAPGKTLHVCDSFQGLPPKQPEDGQAADWAEGRLVASPSAVLENFAIAGLTPPVVHAGWFRQIDDYPDRLCFAFLDGDFHDSIADSLEIVYPRLSPGAVVMIHDYFHPELPGVKTAVDAFLADKPETLEPGSPARFFKR